MPLRFKKGVSLRGVQPEIAIGLHAIEGFFKKNGIEDLWITSCVDGKHGRGSLHYVGYAVDIRIWSIVKDRLKWFVDELNKEMGNEFDCVLEKDHIHVEFQPKEKLNND
jgi:D-alanyl-D-alanine dipeptidase